MQNLPFYNFLKDLLESERVQSSSISKTVRTSKEFEMLVAAKFIDLKTAANNGKYYIVSDKHSLQAFFDKQFPNDIKNVFTGIQNVRSFRDSKARKKESQRVVLLRGNQKVIANGIEIDLSLSTRQFNLFAMQLSSLKAEKLCFIENLDCFMVADKTLDGSYTYIHTYGRISMEKFKRIEAKEILFCPDYDYIGLDEFLKVKSLYPSALLYLPEGYDTLFEKYCKPLKKKNGKEQAPTARLLACDDEKIRNMTRQLLETKHFLEQQIIFKD